MYQQTELFSLSESFQAKQIINEDCGVIFYRNIFNPDDPIPF